MILKQAVRTKSHNIRRIECNNCEMHHEDHKGLGEVSFKFPLRLSKSVILSFWSASILAWLSAHHFLLFRFLEVEHIFVWFNLRPTSIGIIENLILAWSWRWIDLNKACRTNLQDLGQLVGCATSNL